MTRVVGYYFKYIKNRRTTTNSSLDDVQPSQRMKKLLEIALNHENEHGLTDEQKRGIVHRNKEQDKPQVN